MLWRKRGIALVELHEFASLVARIAKGGDVIVLKGDLGAGKTTLVKEVSIALGFKDEVTSPTFAIVAKYSDKDSEQNRSNSIENLIHVDTYRLNHANELYDLGLETIFDQSSVTFIEWGDRIVDQLDSSYFEINIDDSEIESRSIEFQIVGDIDLDRSSFIETEFHKAGWTK